MGKVRLFKMVYIAQEQCKGRNLQLDYYDFVRHYYGPYSRELETDLSELLSEHLLSHSEQTASGFVLNVYEVTSDGVERLNRASIPEQITEVISTVVGKYRDYPLSWLLKEIYRDYPAFLRKETISND